VNLFVTIFQYWKPAVIIAVLLVIFIYFNNTSRFAARSSERPAVFAHRGVGQRFDIPIESNTCTAVHLLRPEHEYLENTIPSMQAAFDRGADVVEFDIHPTTDHQFAVFHDRTLECKTNGSGLTRSHTMADLKALDIGYGYTFDGGRTFPFRGKGIGLMPSMSEVFRAFPTGSFLIDVKDNEANDAALLSQHLSQLSRHLRPRKHTRDTAEQVSGTAHIFCDIRCKLRASVHGIRLDRRCANKLQEFVPIHSDQHCALALGLA
jgi:glycerophosphoryl diester phosphodiesterase